MVASHVVLADWKVDRSESHIGFVATYDGIPFEARFESFNADIRFSPDKLNDAHFDVQIGIASVDSNSPDRDEGMKNQEWFAIDKHPQAHFEAGRFRKISDEEYKAIGDLKLKGVSRTIEVPFSWEQNSTGETVLTAHAELKRGDFNIGTGEWADDEIIGFKVIVQARLKLTQQ